MTLPFRDRRDAGRQLATKLTAYTDQPVHDEACGIFK
jgi:predicted phosphoribosyltransferase